MKLYDSVEPNSTASKGKGVLSVWHSLSKSFYLDQSTLINFTHKTAIR